MVFFGPVKEHPDSVLKTVPHKVHEVKLEGGKTYGIDLESKDFGALLRLEDANGKHLRLSAVEWNPAGRSWPVGAPVLVAPATPRRHAPSRLSADSPSPQKHGVPSSA